MKKTIFVLMMTCYVAACNAQIDFNKFERCFKNVSLPIENVSGLIAKDTLDGKWTNDIIIRKQDTRPYYIDTIGNKHRVKQYFGLYPESPWDYLKDIKNENGEWEEKKCFFYPKVYPIGRLKLNENYTSLIIKVVDTESTFYDLWNFSKNGEVLSVVCLFWGLRDNMESEKVNYIVTNSQIDGNGNITWHENNSGLETFRTYILDDTGYFKIIKETQKGEFEY